MPRRRWNTTVLIGEAGRNLAAHWGQTIALVALSAIIGCGVCLATAWQAADITGRFDTLVGKGVNVITVTADRGAYLSGSECEALNNIPGIDHAGGLAPSVVADSGALPTRSMTIMVGTPNVAQVLWPELAKPGSPGTAIAGAQLSTQYGLVSDSYLNIKDSGKFENLLIAQVAPPSTRNTPYDTRALRIQRPDATITSCLVEATPGAENDVAKLLNSGWFSTPSETYVTPYFVDASTGLTPRQELHQRASSLGPVVGATVLIIVALTLLMARRTEYSLYRLLGVTRPGLILQLSVELLAAILLPIQFGVMVALVIMHGELGPVALQLTLLDYARLNALLLLLPPIGLFSLTRNGVLETFKGS